MPWVPESFAGLGVIEQKLFLRMRTLFCRDRGAGVVLTKPVVLGSTISKLKTSVQPVDFDLGLFGITSERNLT